VKQPKNGGKGAAVRAGLDNATGEYILFQDADLEYSPAEYGKLLHPVRELDADVVIGSRFLAPPFLRVAYFWHKLGNQFITFLFNIMNNTTFTDIYTCYFMFRRTLVPSRDLRTNGWEQQAEILTMAVNRSKVYYEVPISYHGRTYEEGKKIRAHHVLSVMKVIFLAKFYA
jgi:glycosyltransferase involved in cell wall biosynthesis